METLQPAESRSDYRFFRFLAINGARLVMASLFLIALNLAYARDRETIVFLGGAALLAVAVSLVAAMTSYLLFKRRGGKIEKTPKPAGVR